MRDFDFEHLEHMAKRFNPLPTNDPFLDARYEWQKNENGSEWPYYRFFYHLSKMLQPGLVLELGTYQATCAAHFAAGHKDAVIVTVDHHSDPGDLDNQLKVLEAQEEYRNLLYFQGWTTAKIAKEQIGLHALGDQKNVYERVIKQTLYRSRKIDILFIDSWHCYEYAMNDWLTYAPLLNSPALVICDDIIDGDDPQAPIQGMMRFWGELPEPKFLNSNLHPGSNIGFVKI